MKGNQEKTGGAGALTIDTRNEDVLPLADVVAVIRQLGIPAPHEETVRRWAASGVRGVVLESFTMGSRRFTSREAVARFIAATTSGRVARVN